MVRPHPPPPSGYGKKTFFRRVIFDTWFSTCDFRNPSKCLKSVNSQNVIGFLWKPPYFTLSTVDVVYLKFYTSHRIGKVLKKYLFSAQIIKEPYILIFSQWIDEDKDNFDEDKDNFTLMMMIRKMLMRFLILRSFEGGDGKT